MAIKKPIVLTTGQLEELQSGDTLAGALPAGGGAGQMLEKASGTDYDVAWGRKISSGTGAPTGGADGDIYLQTDATITGGGGASMTDAFVATMFLRG